MSGIEVKRETKYSIVIDEPYAKKLHLSLCRAMEAIGKMAKGSASEGSRYQALVNTGTIDDLLSLRTALRSALDFKEENDYA